MAAQGGRGGQEDVSFIATLIFGKATGENTNEQGIGASLVGCGFYAPGMRAVWTTASDFHDPVAIFGRSHDTRVLRASAVGRASKCRDMIVNSVQYPSHRIGVLAAIARVPYLWIAFLFIYVCFFAFPQTDDFCTFGRLYNVHYGNPFIEAWYLYLNWTGRYSASFFTAAVGWLANISPWQLHVIYSISLACLIIFFYAACKAATKTIQSEPLSGVDATPIIYVLCLLLMPSKVEGLYWLTGAVVYFASTSALLITIYLLANEISEDAQSSLTARFIFTNIAVLTCVGFNEFVAVTLGMWMLWHCITVFHNRAVRTRIYIILTTYFGSLCVSLFSPGNFLRNQVLTATRHNMLESVTLTVQAAREFVLSRVIPEGQILIVAFVVCAIIGYGSGGSLRASHRRLLALPATLILSFPIDLFIYAFLAGESAPGRVFDQIYPMAIVGACLLSVMAGIAIGQKRGATSQPVIGMAALLLLGVVCVSSPPVTTVASVVRNFGPTWRSEQIQRNALLTSTTSANPVVRGFQEEKSPRHVLQGADVTGDPSNWINRCVAAYYHLESIRLNGTERAR